MGDRMTKEREAEIRDLVARWDVDANGMAAAEDLLAELDATRDELREKDERIAENYTAQFRAEEAERNMREAYERIARQEATIAELREEVDRYDASANGCADDLHRCQRERDAHAARNRAAAQAIVEAIGSVGPESAEDAALRVVARVRELEAERDAASRSLDLSVQAWNATGGPREGMLALIQRAEAAEARVRELQRDALPSNCALCHGRGSEPPHGPEDGPCPRCGGWTAHKRLVAAEPDALRKRIADLEAQLAAVGATTAPLYTSQERAVLIQRIRFSPKEK